MMILIKNKKKQHKPVNKHQIKHVKLEKRLKLVKIVIN